MYQSYENSDQMAHKAVEPDSSNLQESKETVGKTKTQVNQGSQRSVKVTGAEDYNLSSTF